jgi:hypothetical protein
VVFESANAVEFIEIRDVQLRQTLNLNPKKRLFSPAELFESKLQEAVQPAITQEQRNKNLLTSKDKNLLEAYGQLMTARTLLSGEQFLNAVDLSFINGSHGKEAISEIVVETKLYLSYLFEKNPKASNIARSLVEKSKNQPAPPIFQHYLGKMDVEVFYNKARIFLVAAILYFLCGLILMIRTIRNTIGNRTLTIICFVPVQQAVQLRGLLIISQARLYLIEFVIKQQEL